MFRDRVGGACWGCRPRRRAAVCRYTVAPDGDVPVQRVPENDRVPPVSACPGHGFEHSAGSGEAVARTPTGECDAAVSAPFGAGRFGPVPAAAIP